MTRAGKSGASNGAATGDSLPVHPVALTFPEMTPDEFAGLKADIGARGQVDPVVIYQGQIIDGRHRARACAELGREVVTVEYQGEGAGIMDYIISRNLHRRHLNASQRALIAAKVATMRQGERTDLTPSGERLGQEQAAVMFGVGKRSVSRAAAVLKDAPELVTLIERGDLSVNQAVKRSRPAPTTGSPPLPQAPLAPSYGQAVIVGVIGKEIDVRIWQTRGESFDPTADGFRLPIEMAVAIWEDMGLVVRRYLEGPAFAEVELIGGENVSREWLEAVAAKRAPLHPARVAGVTT